MSKISAQEALKHFSRAKNGNFRQTPPKLQAPFQHDSFTQKILKQKIPEKYYSEISQDLSKFSERLINETHQLGLDVERNNPELKQYNAWGERIDELRLNSSWYKLKDTAAEEGLIAISYERKSAEFSRMHAMAKLSAFHPHSGLFSCPLAMTDGAACVLETQNDDCDGAFGHLTSRDPKHFWTSGQWMTERKGGSDVGGATDTIAVPRTDNHEIFTHNLHGYKWFTSATDSEMCLSLARNVDENGEIELGGRGLSMYYVKVHNESGKLDNIEILGLKNKMGTKGLPTAELLLDGVQARQLGETGRGIPNISTMLHLTRLHNAVAAIGACRYGVHMARSFAKERAAFGRTVDKFPLHVQTLARLETETRAGIAFYLRVAELLGKYEVDKCQDSYLLMRTLSPLLKLYTAKQGVAVSSEVMECFGGSGYIEDSEIPVLLRDCQVLPIWEGTSNVMSLDMLRSLAKSKGEALKVVLEDAAKISRGHPVILKNIGKLANFAKNGELNDVSSRDFSMMLSEVYVGALLVGSCEDEIDQHACDIWLDGKFGETRLSGKLYKKESVILDEKLVFHDY